MAAINDIVLVHFEEAPLFYARIEDIDQDVKPGWYRVRIQALTMPAQDITWILREEYINGAGFTMGGKSMRLEKLEPLAAPEPPETEKSTGRGKQAETPGKSTSGGKVVSLFDKRG